MSNMLKFAFFLLIIAASFNCKHDESAPVEPVRKSITPGTARIEFFQNATSRTITGSCTLTPDKYIQIVGHIYTDDLFSIHFPLNSRVQTFNLFERNPMASIDYNRDWGNGVLEQVGTSLQGGSGTLFIKDINTVKKTVSGTFEAHLSGWPTAWEVSNGTFEGMWK